MHTPLRAATAFLYAASIGLVVGIVGGILAQRLEIAALTALVGFGIASSTSGYVLWRARRRPRPAFLGRTYPY